jgi:hypothetical protein
MRRSFHRRLSSRRCTQIHEWEAIDEDEVRRENPGPLFDAVDPEFRRRVDLDAYGLLDEQGLERPVYDRDGKRVLRRNPVVYRGEPSCGVLVDLQKVEALFNTDVGTSFEGARRDDDEDGEEGEEGGVREVERERLDDDDDDDLNPHKVTVDAYPLAFLRTAGNVRANGVPRCFYPVLRDVNESVRKGHPTVPNPNPNPDRVPPAPRRRRRRHRRIEDSGSEEDEVHEPAPAPMNVDRRGEDGEGATTPSTFQAVKPTSCQMYNYLAHRVAGRAGAHDSQQGTVTGAVAGGFAETNKDKTTASRKRAYCDISLPHERFHTRISSLDDPPTSCRAELVYSVDVAALENKSGS